MLAFGCASTHLKQPQDYLAVPFTSPARHAQRRNSAWVKPHAHSLTLASPALADGPRVLPKGCDDGLISGEADDYADHCETSSARDCGHSTVERPDTSTRLRVGLFGAGDWTSTAGRGGGPSRKARR